MSISITTTISFDEQTLRSSEVCRGSLTPELDPSSNYRCPVCAYRPNVRDITICKSFIAIPHPRHR